MILRIPCDPNHNKGINNSCFIKICKDTEVLPDLVFVGLDGVAGFAHDLLANEDAEKTMAQVQMLALELHELGHGSGMVVPYLLDIMRDDLDTGHAR